MRIVVYDFEVFRYYWVCVLQEFDTGRQIVIENDAKRLRKLFSKNKYIFIGFNSKYYDQAIVRAICTGADNLTVKELNDWIIGGNPWWEFWWFKGRTRFRFNQADVRDDMQAGLSLKAIEGHLGMPIIESSVPFDLNRPLTDREKDEVVAYCRTDVRTTARLVEHRRAYFDTKIRLGEMAGLTPYEAMGLTNAKLVAKYLNARPRRWRDERVYQVPECIKQERIPDDVFGFFAQMDDPDISDDELFSDQLEIEIGGVTTVFAFGGIHGARNRYKAIATKERKVVLYDVNGMYPHTMVNFGFQSRNIPDPDAFKRVVETRGKAKAEGDKTTADALKLVTNTGYGAMLNRYNDLYDPRMGRSVCITGQLALADLAGGYLENVPSVELIQLNTDGVAISFATEDEHLVLAVNAEWEKRTGYSLSQDEIQELYQRDVNNYLMVKKNGDIKRKGGDLVRGISKAGAWNINNNAPIVADAITQFLLKGVKPSITIHRCNDPLAFQLIAKAGGKYSRVYHEVGAAKKETQKVNRVYATKDKKYGTLRKIHNTTGTAEKIAGLPNSCMVINQGSVDIDRIDKDWYIRLAQDRINKFLPEGEVNGKEKERGTQIEIQDWRTG